MTTTITITVERKKSNEAIWNLLVERSGNAAGRKVSGKAIRSGSSQNYAGEHWTVSSNGKGVGLMVAGKLESAILEAARRQL